MRYLIKVSLFSFIAILLTSNSSTAQSQEKGIKHETRINKMTEKLSEELDLSDTQVKEVKALFRKFGERKKALRDQFDRAERAEMKPAMEQIKEDFEKEMKTILTPGQFKQFKAMPKPGPRGQHRKHNKAAKAFHKENVYPILLAQRVKLEDKISEADKAELAELRKTLKAEKARHKAEKKGERPDLEKRQANRQKRKNDPNRQKVKALVEKYQEDIQVLMEEVRPQLEKLREAFEKEQGESSNPHPRKDKGSKSERHMTKKMARFLLMDPKRENENIPPAAVSTITDVKVYPNPSQGISQIEYTLQSSGLVTIELHDKNGNLIDTIEQSKKAAGQYKRSIDFAKYTLGVYYVILKDANGQIVSQKVVR